MQDTFLQVFVVALGLLMNLNNDSHVEEWDAGMQEHEEKLLREEEKLNQEMDPSGHLELKENDTTIMDLETVLQDFKVKNDSAQKVKTGNERDAQTSQDDQDNIVTANLQESGLQGTKADEVSQTHTSKTSKMEKNYIWFIWRTFSIFSFIHFFWKYIQRKVKLNGMNSLFTSTPEDMPLVDCKTLQLFHSQCIEMSSSKKHREEELLEGFIQDLLESMKSICNENGGMVIEKVELEDVHNITVPFTPPKPYFFECLCINRADDALLYMQMCSQIMLLKNEQIQNGCPCQASDADMVRLLHSENDMGKMKSNDFGKLLCKRGSNFLSKAQVNKWFQSIIRQAWLLIASKYEFELSSHNVNIPGALILRFRSGEKIHFFLKPVIRFDLASHFFITPCSPINLDTFWPLSLAKYEDTFLTQISERLPDKSCHIQTLEIALFLHKKQTMLTGSSALKDLHFKTALMHLVLTKDHAEWRPDFVASRLQDFLAFMMKSLKTRKLLHVLIGNPLAQDVIQVPAKFTQSKPINLFHPLVVHECVYKNAVMHLQELLKNAQMLLNDYLDKLQ